MQKRTSESGLTTLLVVAFMGVFLLVLGTITSYVFEQAKYGRALFSREQALYSADSGLEYYRWFLAHNPSIMTSGSGLVSPYTYNVTDPENTTLGTAQITATANLQCGIVQWVDLTSVGRSVSSPGYARALAARYMKRSVAEYAYLYNSSVWFGSSNAGIGPYHANNGMRMDGWSNSTVSAAVSQIWCDSSFGCSTAQWQNGVFGNSTTTSLWSYPVSTIDFTSMALNFSTMKTYATNSGIMLNPTYVTRAGVQQGSTFASVGGVDNKGYHLIFNSDGTVTIYRVTATNGDTIYSYNALDGWRYDYPVIASETLVASNVSLPSSCAIIYSQAKTWIEGPCRASTRCSSLIRGRSSPTSSSTTISRTRRLMARRGSRSFRRGISRSGSWCPTRSVSAASSWRRPASMAEITTIPTRATCLPHISRTSRARS